MPVEWEVLVLAGCTISCQEPAYLQGGPLLMHLMCLSRKNLYAEMHGLMNFHPGEKSISWIQEFNVSLMF